ncbi:flagellar accessory protein FlaH [Thermococcus chitonophagus]|uniref:Flagella-related protein FlaH n=1 Tax=Thermococcus chitonophagus TaxID=54262 RepID=A0A160VT59_9EURY|nr:ATPase domain-containing protein [Thermococcus chitonophagus]ASJ17475.1 flagellar accessory protein FlaH [Thermococcus chitonophagus]CUX78122.1 Flagella-related protein FlaH [Thermococcus chitonophagus]
MVEELLRIDLKGDELHRRLGGGIPAGTIMLIEGDRGTGKSILSQRLLYGFLMNGYTASYISSQYTTVEYVKQMMSISYDVIPFLIRKKLVFVSLYPLLSGVSEERKFLSRLLGEPRLWEQDIVVIDSFSSVLSREQEVRSVRNFLMYIKRLSSLGKVIILTANPEELPRDVLFLLEEASTLLMRLNVRVFGGDLKNSATIVKYNNAKGVFQKIIPFRVEPKVGLVVEIAAVV